MLADRGGALTLLGADGAGPGGLGCVLAISLILHTHEGLRSGSPIFPKQDELRVNGEAPGTFPLPAPY